MRTHSDPLVKFEPLVGTAGFEQLRSEWNDLVHRSWANTLFMTWEWQTTWWRHWGSGEVTLLTWRETTTDSLIGLVPLYLDTAPDGARRLLLVGGIEVSDYLDLVIVPDYAEVVFQGLVAWLHSAAAPAWDRLELVNVPEGSPTLGRFADLAGQQWQTSAAIEDVCPVVMLPEDWEGYLSLLDKHQRHEVRRKLRKIEQESTVRWWISASPAEVTRDVESFINLHQLSSVDKDDFMTEPMKAYFRDLAAVLHANGWLVLALLSVDGNPASALFSMVWQDRWLLYNSGYDPVNYRELSTGIVLQAYCMQEAIRRDVRVFDFLQGNETYKYRLGGQDTRVWRLVVSRD